MLIHSLSTKHENSAHLFLFFSQTTSQGLVQAKASCWKRVTQTSFCGPLSILFALVSASYTTPPSFAVTKRSLGISLKLQCPLLKWIKKSVAERKLQVKYKIRNILSSLHAVWFKRESSWGKWRRYGTRAQSPFWHESGVILLTWSGPFAAYVKDRMSSGMNKNERRWFGVWGK